MTKTLLNTGSHQTFITQWLYKFLVSLASGEAPICLTITIVLALRNAIAAARKDAGQTGWFRMGKIITTMQQFDRRRYNTPLGLNFCRLSFAPR